MKYDTITTTLTEDLLQTEPVWSSLLVQVTRVSHAWRLNQTHSNHRVAGNNNFLPKWMNYTNLEVYTCSTWTETLPHAAIMHDAHGLIWGSGLIWHSCATQNISAALHTQTCRFSENNISDKMNIMPTSTSCRLNLLHVSSAQLAGVLLDWLLMQTQQ